MAVPSPLERQQLGVTIDPTYWHRVRFELVVGAARRARCERLLDVGAGSGLLGDWVASHSPGLAYMFSEPSPVLRARLVERFGAAELARDDAPIRAGTMVAMLDVLEHIEDDCAALNDLHARMQPGTHLVVTVPAMQWAYSSWDAALGHHRRYNRRALVAVVRAAGFTVLETSYLFPELTPLLIVRRLRRASRTSADFPSLGATADAVGYRVASVTAAARRVWPFGTSLVAVATRAQ